MPLPQDSPKTFPKDFNVMIGTPCFGGVVHQGYMLATANLLMLGTQMGFGVNVELLGYDSLITRSRNTLVARFLDSPTATHLLFVDADITYQPAHVLRMANFGQEIVAGMYPLKVRDWSAEAINRVRTGESLESAPLRYVGVPCQGEARESREGFVTGEYAGTGFMMIQRSALLTMIEAYPELKFAAAHDRAHQNPSPNQYAFFDCMIDPETRHYLSEDYTFCKRWRDLGGQLWLDTQSSLIHTGGHDFIGHPELRYPIRPELSLAS